MGGNTIVPLLIIVIGGMNWGFSIWFANRSYRRRKKH